MTWVAYLEDGVLWVPRTAVTGDVIGDGWDTCGPDDPEYEVWLQEALSESVVASGWDESEHPRWPKGHPDGGKFRPEEIDPWAWDAEHGGEGGPGVPSKGEQVTLESLGVGPQKAEVPDPGGNGMTFIEVDPIADSDATWIGSEFIAHRPGQHMVRSELRKVLDEYDVTLDTYKEMVADWLKEEASGDIGVRTPVDVGLRIVEDGRFKSQFESERSQGVLNRKIRYYQEALFFGNWEVPDEKRPIYGYVVGTDASLETAEQYGEVLWVLKGEVRQRTTATGLDSLSRPVVPGPINNPGWRAMVPPGYADLGGVVLDPISEGSPEYVETQTHGGVSLDDVKRVVIDGYSDGPDANDRADLISMLRSRGIPVEVWDEPDEGFTSAAWDEAAHPRHPATGPDGVASPDDGGKFAPKEGGGPAVAKGDTPEEMLEDMGAYEMEQGQDRHPERYYVHPKSGFTVRKPGVVVTEEMPPVLDPDGWGRKPPRVRDVIEGEGFKPPAGFEDATSLGFGKYQVGEPRPPDYLFRAVSEDEWQQAVSRGYVQSDGRMNLTETEGTVTAFSNPLFYFPGNLSSDKPGTYEGRVIRIKYRDEDGWRHDRDGYVKSSKPIPIAQVDMVTPKLKRVRAEDSSGDPVVRAAAWDESKVVRVPAGTDNQERDEREGGQFAPKEEYAGVHDAPDRTSGASLDNLTGVYPDDIYSSDAARLYGHGGDAVEMDRETAEIIQEYRGEPNAMIEVFRAVPEGVEVINPGDWVTPNRHYAEDHAARHLDEGAHVVSMEVRAGDLFTDGNSIHEFGYDPYPEGTVEMGLGGEDMQAAADARWEGKTDRYPVERGASARRLLRRMGLRED